MHPEIYTVKNVVFSFKLSFIYSDWEPQTWRCQLKHCSGITWTSGILKRDLCIFKENKHSIAFSSAFVWLLQPPKALDGAPNTFQQQAQLSRHECRFRIFEHGIATTSPPWPPAMSLFFHESGCRPWQMPKRRRLCHKKRQLLVFGSTWESRYKIGVF